MLKEPSDRRRGPAPRAGGSAVALPLARPALGELVARAREAMRTGYWARLVPLLGVLAVLTHLPSFARTVWSPDEGYLATQARMLAGGGVLYDTVVDRKPPLLPWLYEGAFALFGSASLWPLRVLAIGAHLATAVLLAAIARKRWGNRAGAAAGALYLLVSIGLSPEDSQAATFEVFMLPATAAAFWFAQNRRWGPAGAATAAAALTKQTGGAVLFAVLWLLWRDGRRYGGTATRASLPALAFGFGLPVAVIALSTGVRNFLFWVITGSSDYASLGGSWLTMIGRALGNSAILAAAALGLLIPLARRWRRLSEDADLWVWFGSSWLGVITGFHFFGHYYLQLVPPLVLLGVGAVVRGAARWRPVLIYTAVASAVFCGLGFFWPHQPLQHAVSVAADVTQDTAPQDSVLVWGMHPEMYWLADRRPASRYLTAGLLTNFSGGRDAQSVGVDQGVADAWKTFDAEMSQQLPEIIVDDSGNAPYAPKYIAPMRALLAAHYQQVEIDGTAVIYRLKGSPACVRPPSSLQGKP
ncbi:ArnT family glycosyltransferase [Streptacidiphilus sp. MAP12-16]|uniref:ArnT family glycosyltransferase n=1 Tax=Streptacidiphilus sp. MAP12-16 TaxID=3156300 RepID=UPI003514C2BF